MIVDTEKVLREADGSVELVVVRPHADGKVFAPGCVNTTPQMSRFRGAKVCSKWLQERIDDHNIQSDYKCTIGLKVQK